MIIGAVYAEGAGGSPSQAGETYIIYGPLNDSGVFNLSTANVTFYGIDDSDRSGTAAGSGDLDLKSVEEVMSVAVYVVGVGCTISQLGAS